MALTKIKSSGLAANAITTSAVVSTLTAGQNITILANGLVSSTSTASDGASLSRSYGVNMFLGF